MILTGKRWRNEWKQMPNYSRCPLKWCIILLVVKKKTFRSVSFYRMIIFAGTLLLGPATSPVEVYRTVFAFFSRLRRHSSILTNFTVSDFSSQQLLSYFVEKTRWNNFEFYFFELREVAVKLSLSVHTLFTRGCWRNFNQTSSPSQLDANWFSNCWLKFNY